MASMSLLDLPLVTLRHIVQYLPPVDIVRLAKSSHEARRLIESTNLYVDTFRVSIGEKQCKLDIEFFYVDRRFTWIFANDANAVRRNRGQKLWVVDDPIKELKEQVEWLIRLVRFPVSKVHVRYSQLHGFFKVLDWSALHQCESLFLDSVSFLEPHCDKFTDLERLELRNCHAYTDLFLRKMRVNYVKVSEFEYTASSVNQLIKRWMHGEQFQFKHAEFCLEPDRFIAGTVLESISRTPWDPTVRQRYFPGAEPLDCDLAIDVYQEGSGLLASIVVNRSIHFVIWNDRFPGLNL